MEILPQKHLGAGFSVSCLGWLVRKTWAKQKLILVKHVSLRDSSYVVSPCWRRWSHGWRFRGRLVSTFFRHGPCLPWKKTGFNQQMERGAWQAVSHTSFIFNGLPDIGTNSGFWHLFCHFHLYSFMLTFYRLQFLFLVLAWLVVCKLPLSMCCLSG